MMRESDIAIGRLVSSARKACRECGDILTQTRENFHIRERERIGPRERRWRRGDIATPVPRPRVPDPPDYYLTDKDRRCIEAINAVMTIARATKRPATRKAMFNEAAIHFERLRRAAERDQAEFTSIIRRECDLSYRRAAEIMALRKRRLQEKSST